MLYKLPKPNLSINLIIFQILEVVLFNILMWALKENFGRTNNILFFYNKI